MEQMVASFVLVPFAHLLSRFLQHSILSSWDKLVQSLDRPIHLDPSIRLALVFWPMNLALELGKSFLAVFWRILKTDTNKGKISALAILFQSPLASYTLRPLCRVSHMWLSLYALL